MGKNIWLLGILCFAILGIFGGARYFNADKRASVGTESESNIIVHDRGNYPGTKQLLAKRKNAQFETLEQFKVFYDFKFEDQIEKSNITFIHKIVDDAGKYYKAVHYDHGNGIAVADIDNDGFLDIYFVTQLGSNELYKNIGNGTFENITKSAGVGLEDKVSVSASFADIDNDGDQDLYVTTVRMGNVLFENNGSGVFKDISKASGTDYVGHSSATTFFDYNNDGLLDIFVTNVGQYTSDERGRGGYFIGHRDGFSSYLDSERAEQSILFKNLGSNTFKDVSKETRLQDMSWSGDSSITDFNNDNYPDIYVLSMHGDDHYYENQNGQYFVKKTIAHFPKTPPGAMGIKFFDFNNDGFDDLYISDMHSDMSTRLRSLSLNYQEEKRKDIWEKFADEVFFNGSSSSIFGNAFYKNLGNGTFAEVSDDIGAENYWPWGISVDDLNADGFQDVFLASSMNYPFKYGVNSVLLNNKGEAFLDSEFIVGIEPRKNGEFDKEWFVLECAGEDLGHRLCEGKTGTISVRGTLGTRSSAIFDIDNDGDLDIVTNEFNSEPQLFISNLSDNKKINFIKIKLVGTVSNRNAIGAKIKVYTDSGTYSKYNDGKSGYLSQSIIPLYFGLGESTAIDKVEVIWPTGEKTVLKENFPINKTYTIKEEGEY